MRMVPLSHPPTPPPCVCDFASHANLTNMRALHRLATLGTCVTFVQDFEIIVICVVVETFCPSWSDTTTLLKVEPLTAPPSRLEEMLAKKMKSSRDSFLAV